MLDECRTPVRQIKYEFLSFIAADRHQAGQGKGDQGGCCCCSGAFDTIGSGEAVTERTERLLAIAILASEVQG